MVDFDLDRHNVQHIHFIGIGGISMSAIAEVLLNFGYKVSGSDMKASNITDKLSQKGASIHIGHDENNLEDCDLVVYTAAVKENHPERIKAHQNNIPTISRAEMMGLLMKKFKKSIAIAGTHGKTTTTSMVALILEYSHLDPTILVGGELDEIGGNVKIGCREYFVTEACEYVGSFLKFFPHFGIILNIEEDHLDYFKNLDHILDTFTEFSNLIPNEGALIACCDDINIQKILPNIHCPILTFGLDEHATYQGHNIHFDEQGYPSFDVSYKGEILGRFSLGVIGQHNIYNALAAIATCHRLGVSIENIQQNITRFHGTHRRFDVLGKINDQTIVDDYAHHPTEIKATLKATLKVPHHQIWCIFQPHTYTRTQTLLDDFALSFKDADHVIITDIYAAREKDMGQIHAKDLVKKIEQNHPSVTYIKDFKTIQSYINTHAKPNDIILTMGAGDIYKVGHMLLNQKS